MSAPATATTSSSSRSAVVWLALAMALWQGHHAWQLWQDRQQLQLAHANQQVTVESAAKLRAGLDSIATATAALATQGNRNAVTVVTELRKRGITINPNAQTAATLIGK